MGYATRGKRVRAMPAQPTGQGGTHGGTFLLYDRDQMFKKVEEFSMQGHGWLVAQWTFKDSTVTVVRFYMKSGEGLQGKTNSAIWGSLVAFLRNLQQPYIVLGDFNEDLDEIAKTKIAQKSSGQGMKQRGKAVILIGLQATLRDRTHRRSWV